MLLNTVHHIAIIGSNYAKTREFYVDKLGFEIIREAYRPDFDDHKLELRLGNCELEIFGRPKSPARPADPQPCGMWHLCFHAPDIEESIRQLNAVGIPVDPIKINASNGKRIAFFYDPDGLPLELHE